MFAQFSRKESLQSKANIGPRRRMQQRTYPFVSVILSPGSKIGHTPRKNPSPSGAGNLPHQRISRLAQDACNYLHKPFAAKKDYSTVSHKLQVFFGVFAKFFYGFSTFCRSLPVMHQLPCFCQKQGRFWCNTTGFCVQGGFPGRSICQNGCGGRHICRPYGLPVMLLLPQNRGRGMSHPAGTACLILYIIR